MRASSGQGQGRGLTSHQKGRKTTWPQAQIVGWSHTAFGKSEAETTEALIAQALAPALEHAGIGAEDVDGIFVGVYNNGFSRQDFQGALVAMADERFAHTPATRYENACATGSAALHGAMDFIESGRGRIALVVGAEKMTATPIAEVGDILLGASYRAEEAEVDGGFCGACSGRSPPAISSAYGDKSEELAMIAAKNHANGMATPWHICASTSMWRFAIRSLTKNPRVAGPLRRTDARWSAMGRRCWCWPIADRGRG